MTCWEARAAAAAAVGVVAARAEVEKLAAG